MNVYIVTYTMEYEGSDVVGSMLLLAPDESLIDTRLRENITRAGVSNLRLVSYAPLHRHTTIYTDGRVFSLDISFREVGSV